MRILALVVAGVVLGGCASDRAAYSAKVSADFASITGPSASEWTTCAKSFIRNFQGKTSYVASLDVALTAYCGKQENAIRMAGFQYGQLHPGPHPGYMTPKTDAFIAGMHQDVIGVIVARQLQGR